VQILHYLIKKIFSAFTDILPIVAVIVFFQIGVIQKPFENLHEILVGIGLVILGLFIFIMGLENALFPLGERMALQFAQIGNAGWIIFFGFALGFSTTIAEPALSVIANKAGHIAAEGKAIANNAQSIDSFVLGLRLTVAFSVGFAIALGVVRIIKGWPLVWFIVVGYSLIMFFTSLAPKEIIGIAYDAGGITTSTITVPLVTALGLGLASSIRGRNPIVDGFGLIALASLTPIMCVMGYGMFVYGFGGQ